MDLIDQVNKYAKIRKEILDSKIRRKKDLYLL